MNRKQIGVSLAWIAFGFVGGSLAARADDSAASIAAGGLVPRHEARIVMAKEVLLISLNKVVVDYDFRNDSNQDVTTEVAFPIPPYTNDWAEQDLAQQSFADFHLWVNHEPAEFKSEAKAYLKGKDVTALLAADSIDVKTFGHFEETSGTQSRNRMPDIDRLPAAERKKLNRLGLIDLDPQDPYAKWTVHLQYHWTQTFPAHSTVHIRHEYSPTVGSQLLQIQEFKKALAKGKRLVSKPLLPGRPQNDADLLTSFCPDPSFLRAAVHSIEMDLPESGYYTSPQWVDFILTSANTWKQPIEDFTLIVERGKSELEDTARLISFCSPKNTAVQKVDANHFQVHLTGFVPASELHIGFFDLAKPRKATQESSKRK